MAATRATPGPLPSASAAFAHWSTASLRFAQWKTRWIIKIPPNAQLIRNLMIAAQYVHDHVMHFYHLHALDWVDVVSALDADPPRRPRSWRSRSANIPKVRPAISPT